MAVSKEVWKCNHPPWRLLLYERKLQGIICCWSLWEILLTAKIQTERAFHAQIQLLLCFLTYTCYLQSKAFRTKSMKRKIFLKKGSKCKTTAVHCHICLLVCLFVCFCSNDINRLVCIAPVNQFSSFFSY